MPGAVDWISLAGFVKFIGYTKACLKLVFRLLKRCGVNEHYVAMQTELAAYEASESRNDSLVTRGGIVSSVDQGLAGGITDLVIAFFQIGRDNCVPSSAAAVCPSGN